MPDKISAGWLTSEGGLYRVRLTEIISLTTIVETYADTDRTAFRIFADTAAGRHVLYETDSEEEAKRFMAEVSLQVNAALREWAPS